MLHLGCCSSPRSASEDFRQVHKQATKLYEIVYIFWKFIQYTIHWDKTQISLSDKMNVQKCTLFFSRPPTHHSFSFNSRFLYMSCKDFPFSILSRFFKVYYVFVQEMTSTHDFKTSQFLSKLKKSHTQFCFRTSDF